MSDLFSFLFQTLGCLIFLRMIIYILHSIWEEIQDWRKGR